MNGPPDDPKKPGCPIHDSFIVMGGVQTSGHPADAHSRPVFLNTLELPPTTPPTHPPTNGGWPTTNLGAPFMTVSSSWVALVLSLPLATYPKSHTHPSLGP
jgi:hypothetical protein